MSRKFCCGGPLRQRDDVVDGVQSCRGCIIGLVNAKPALGVLIFLLCLSSSWAHAGDVDTQFIFGFTQGSDVGELREKEIESETVGRFGKTDGSYAVLTSNLRAEFVPYENVRLEVGAVVNYSSISGVSGLDDRSDVQFAGFALEGRYRLLDRRTAPVGLTISAEPHWTRIEDTSGELVAGFGSEFVVAIDKELVPNRIFAALNLRYDPEWTHVLADDIWLQQSTLGISGAVTAQVAEGVFFGIETHYVRAYDGITANMFLGDALFVGPTTYLRLSKAFAISAALSVQVAGNAVSVPGSLNLVDFERLQARLRFEYNF